MKQKIDDITIGNDRRRLDEQKVRELAESIKSIGLLNPITVTNENKLVAGEHRLEACRLLGWTEIETCELRGNECLRQLAEIDENLVRNDLDAISVGELSIKRDEILDSMGLRAKRGDNQYTHGRAATALPKTTETIADAMGVSKRTLKENKQLARDLVPEAKEVVRTAEVYCHNKIRRQKLVTNSRTWPSWAVAPSTKWNFWTKTPDGLLNQLV